MISSQYLLLVLVLILVGIAIILAVNLFKENAASANLDRVTEFLMELGIRAQKYYMTPNFLAGGGSSFSGITANAQGMALLTNIPENEFGAFSVLVAGTDSEVSLQGVGVEDGDGDGTNCTAIMRVLPDSLQLTIINR